MQGHEKGLLVVCVVLAIALLAMGLYILTTIKADKVHTKDCLVINQDGNQTHVNVKKCAQVAAQTGTLKVVPITASKG